MTSFLKTNQLTIYVNATAPGKKMVTISSDFSALITFHDSGSVELLYSENSSKPRDEEIVVPLEYNKFNSDNILTLIRFILRMKYDNTDPIDMIHFTFENKLRHHMAMFFPLRGKDTIAFTFGGYAHIEVDTEHRTFLKLKYDFEDYVPEQISV